MDAKVREVAKGFEYEAKSFKAYDMNGYRFHTDKHMRERPNRRSINSADQQMDVTTMEPSKKFMICSIVVYKE